MAITDFTVTRGNLFEQVEMVFDDLVSLILRIYKAGSERLQEQIEIEWTVGEYPLGDYEGRNMVIRYTTDIENVSPAGYPTGTKLETDSSGRGWIQRYTGMSLPSQHWSTSSSRTNRPGNSVIDYRPNIHDFEQTSPIAGNYWPIASFARISDTIVKDVKTEMTVIPDRPHGGGSLSVGQLEIMVQRRVNNIDESERIPSL